MGKISQAVTQTLETDFRDFVEAQRQRRDARLAMPRAMIYDGKLTWNGRVGKRKSKFVLARARRRFHEKTTRGGLTFPSIPPCPKH